MTTPVTQAQGTSTAEHELDLVSLVGVLIDHYKVILGVTVAFTLVALLIALFSTPVYQADALVQVEQKRGNALLSSVSKMLPDASPVSAPEIQLLQSRMILGKTINDLRLRTVVAQDYFPVFGRGWARLTGEAPGELVISRLTLPQRHGQDDVLTVTVREKGHFQLAGNGFSTGGAVGELLEKDGLAINIAQIRAKPGTRFTVTQRTELEAVNDLQQRFSVSEKGKGSGMLGISITGEDPRLIAAVLNNIADNYLQQNIARQAAQDSKSLAFLQKQLPEVRAALDKAEDKLNVYRRQRDSVDLNLEAKAVLDQTVNADNQLNELTFREAEIAQLYKKDHPVYRALMEKRQTLEQEKARLNKRVSAMPATQQAVLRLSRDVESGRAVYLQLLSRQQELSIAQSSAVGNVRIIDPAVTQPRPMKPKKAITVALGLLLGLMVSTGIVLVRAVLRRGIETPEQLEEQGINVYATVPVSEWLEKRTGLRRRTLFSPRFRQRTRDVPFLAVDNPGDLSVEAIRSLRTSLHFAMMEASSNILMISGATPGCGKTFVSSMLAAMVAQSQRRVLFIDADMRRGYVHDLLSLSNQHGLSEVLSGQSDVDRAVQASGKGGFDVITRGQVPPDPAELLMHARFQQLMTWASGHYDMVIIDTPPVLAVTDAAVIGRYAGTSLVVARFAVNSVKEMTVCVQRLEQGGVNIKGAILNGVIRRAGSRYGYGYPHYGYHYADKN